MRSQPNRNYVSNDDVMTPPSLCKKIVDYFNPQGSLLEPCKGKGNFLKYMPGADWCEIKKGVDFMEYSQSVDWIITNPPWSKFKPFLIKAMEVSENIVFLVTINHLWTKARLKAIYDNGFYIAEIIAIPTPKKFPQMGFQLGVVHIKRGQSNHIKFKIGIP